MSSSKSGDISLCLQKLDWHCKVIYDKLKYTQIMNIYVVFLEQQIGYNVNSEI